MTNMRNKVYVGVIIEEDQIKGLEYSIRRAEKTHGVRLKKALAKAILKQLKKIRKDKKDG